MSHDRLRRFSDEVFKTIMHRYIHENHFFAHELSDIARYVIKHDKKYHDYTLRDMRNLLYKGSYFIDSARSPRRSPVRGVPEHHHDAHGDVIPASPRRR